jgi:transposase-like protein
LGSKKHTAEEIIGKLRQAEVALAQGSTVPDVCRRLGVAEQTYYRWRKEYGGLGRDQARRLKDLERENSRLKKLVADLSLDNAILREAAQGNF